MIRKKVIIIRKPDANPNLNNMPLKEKSPPAVALPCEVRNLTTTT